MGVWFQRAIYALRRVSGPQGSSPGSLEAGAWAGASEVDRERLAQAASRSGRFFEVSRDLLCTVGFDGYLKELNGESWTRALGWSREELGARPFIDFVHPDERERTGREVARLVSGESTVGFVVGVGAKDGSSRWFDWSASVPDDEEKIYASGRDITERVSAEAALERNERQTRRILETAHDAFVSMDADGAITGWNPQAQAIFGWKRVEVLGRSLSETILPEADRDAHREALNLFLSTGDSPIIGRLVERSALNRDGREFPVEFTMTPLETDAGVTFHAFLRDVSRRTYAQERLAFALEEAVESSRMKSEFVANVTHELRTPLNGVIGLNVLLLDTQLSEEQREYADAVTRSGAALKAVIDDLLDFSKLEAGRLEIDRRPFELRPMVQSASALVSPLARGRGIALDVRVEDTVPEMIHGDGDRLRQVLGKLLTNAVKFTVEGQVALRVSSEQRPGLPRRLRFEVADTGIGIAPESTARIFQSFAQADGSSSRRYGGTGLGLAISEQLVGLMGGEIGVDSTLGEGSTFWFAVPLRAARPVLLVEDDAINRLVALRLLQRRGFDVEVATDGREALEKHEGGSFGAVFMDCELPSLNGYDTTAEIRRREEALRHTPIIAMTANTQPGDRERCLAAGMNDYLAKPVRSAALDEVISRWLPAEGFPQEVAATAVDPPEDAVPETAVPPVVVRSVLFEVCRDDEQAVAAIVAMFLDQSRLKLAELASAVAESESEAVARLAHGLKGSSASVGAMRLADVSDRLCQAARSERVEEAAELHEELGRTFELTSLAFGAGSKG